MVSTKRGLSLQWHRFRLLLSVCALQSACSYPKSKPCGFLADRTAVLRLSSSVCTEWIVAKRCVWEQKYWQEVVWEIDWYQNEWPWPLFRVRIKVTSTIALHLTLNISETVRDRGFGSKWPPTGNGILAIKMVTWPMTSRDPQRCCEVVRSAILATAWLLIVYYSH